MEKVIELQLDPNEQANFDTSVAAVKKDIETLASL
jgi:malate/lactate dehydrogenase